MVMVNAASSAVRVTVRLTGALMPSGVCAAATQASTGIRIRNRCFIRCLSLRQAVSDVGVKSVLRSRAGAAGTEGAPNRPRADPGDRVSVAVERFAYAPDPARSAARGVGT